MSEIEFFGSVDKTQTGKVSSEMPAWFFDVHVEKLEEGIGRKERMLERGQVPQDNIFMVKNEIRAEKDKLNEILKSKPVLRGGQKDMVYKEYMNLARQIKESLPTHRENQLGFVNPRDELKRINTQHIEISDKMAKACGIEANKGKITGKQAEKCYKMMGKILGENTNVERLRREGRSESYRTMEELTKKVLEKVAG